LAALAGTDPLSGLLAAPGTAGLGVLIRSELLALRGRGLPAAQPGVCSLTHRRSSE